MEQLVMYMLTGISYGIVLFILASGLSIILGLMRILNLVHGALYMIGAYIAGIFYLEYGLNYWLVLLIAGMFTGIIGLGLERGFLSHLRDLLNEQVLVTVGFVYIIMNTGYWIWGYMTFPPVIPSFATGSLNIGDMVFPFSRLWIIGIGIIVAAGFWWIQNKTRAGAIVRAGVDDIQMTKALGVNVERVFVITFFVCTFMAGFAGVLGSQLVGAYIGLAWEFLMPAVIIVVVGGLGSIEGALLGSVIIGLADAFGRAVLQELGLFIFYAVMVLILLIRPSGILGRKIV